MNASAIAEGSVKLEGLLEPHRSELTAYCNRMLGSAFEAEDAVQETLLRAWRGFDRFEDRAALRSWLYRIAPNVTFDMLSARQRRARPMELGPALIAGKPLDERSPRRQGISPRTPVDAEQSAFLARHVDALERYDLDSLATLNRSFFRSAVAGDV